MSQTIYFIEWPNEKHNTNELTEFKKKRGKNKKDLDF